MSRSYYLLRDGRLRRKDNTVYAEVGEERVPIPIENMDELYVFAEADFNTRLMTFLGRNGVAVHFFDYYGNYAGSFAPRERNVSGSLVVRQVQHYLAPGLRLSLARQFVTGAAQIMLRNLRYYDRRDCDLKAALAGVGDALAAAAATADLPALLGAEGRAKECYYSAFNRILKVDVDFKRRVRRPPDNMVNAMISFGNALTYSAVLREIHATPLHPAVSFLHEPLVRRFALALDVAELFKPLIADRMMFSLFNTRALSAASFEAASGGTMLTPEGRRAVVAAFDARLGTTVHHRRLKRNVSYRTLIRLECFKLVRHLLGDAPYEPLRPWW